MSDEREVKLEQMYISRGTYSRLAEDLAKPFSARAYKVMNLKTEKGMEKGKHNKKSYYKVVPVVSLPIEPIICAKSEMRKILEDVLSDSTLDTNNKMVNRAISRLEAIC